MERQTLRKKKQSQTLLTPEEQKDFEAQLEAAKRIYGPMRDVLAQKTKEIRDAIIAGRDKQALVPDTFLPRERLLTLPGLVPVIAEPQMSPLSNWIAKSSIFAPRKYGNRKDTGSNWVELPSPRGVTIYYNGPELDMSDHTLYLHLIKLAEGRAPNETIYINRAKLLKRCGYKSIGKSAYQWLNSAFDRLMQANIKIVVDNTRLSEESQGILGADVNASELSEKGRKLKKLTLTLKIMGELMETPETGDYYFTLPPTSLALFANQLYGYNDLLKRNALQEGKNADLAAWLQSYICADQTGPHDPVLVETLWKHSGSNSRLNDFTARLKGAFENCQQNGVILSWGIEKNSNKKHIVTWKR